jgi:hypothetical protein
MPRLQPLCSPLLFAYDGGYCMRVCVCRDLDEHYRRAIAANPRNAFILREFPPYIASYDKYVVDCCCVHSLWSIDALSSSRPGLCRRRYGLNYRLPQAYDSKEKPSVSLPDGAPRL